MSKKRVEYSETFKAEAIAKIKENNGNVTQKALELAIPMQTLANWQRKANGGQLKGTDSYNPELMAALDEIKELKKKLKIVQEEREILKRQRRTLPRTNSPNTPSCSRIGYSSALIAWQSYLRYQSQATMTGLTVALAKESNIITAVNYWSNLLMLIRIKAMGMNGYISI